MSSNFYLDNEDLRFHIERGFDWSEIVHYTEMEFQDPDGFKTTEEACEFYRDVLVNVGEYVAKEIAPLMNISVRGVEISRYRLRKKLELETDDNLVDFILKI